MPIKDVKSDKPFKLTIHRPPTNTVSYHHITTFIYSYCA